MKTIYGVINLIREGSNSERHKGTRFECATRYFLESDPAWSSRITDVKLWEDSELCTGQDVGIDLVAKDILDGTYWAIQCKCLAEEASLSFQDTSTFFATAEADKRYGHLLISTTAGKISSNLVEQMRKTLCVLINLDDMAESSVDWEDFASGGEKDQTKRVTFDPRPHQKQAIEQISQCLSELDRCKAIMACGTGKTLMSLRLTETMLAGKTNPFILFCAPSIALVGQSMREWMCQSRTGLRSLVVCSDAKASRTDEDLIGDTLTDLAFPATTDPVRLMANYNKLAETDGPIAIFSTYQSIQVIADAQAAGMPDFDIIICDEAHRTTGFNDSSISKEEATSFTKVHDQELVHGNKRLYMTATERIYGTEAKRQGNEESYVIASMDDESIYGPVAYEISFAEAVEAGLLTDYKVIVLAISEEKMPSGMQHLLSTDGELQMPDVAKIIGTWKGLAQHGQAAQETAYSDDIFLIDDLDTMPEHVPPLHRAVGFCSTIADSKRIVSYFNQVTEKYAEEVGEELHLTCELDHVDGGMNSKLRTAKLRWLEQDASTDDEDVCRILCNARCLSEGVDVPSLDAVIFFAPKKSEIDVIQGVGRVMRSFKGKKYGYIILPVFIPAGMTPEESLNSSKTFDVVWKILQALRSHDKRMDAFVNSIPFRKKKGEGGGDVIGKGGRGGDDPYEPKKPKKPGEDDYQYTIDFGRADWEDAILTRMVEKCGTRVYWDAWAADVAKIAERHIETLSQIIEEDKESSKSFETFLIGLRDSLNQGITKQDAIEMVAQHMITIPVFDALFGNFEFKTTNPISIAVEQFLSEIDSTRFESPENSRILDDLYASVRRKAAVMNTDAGRQQLIKDLYENFFKEAFRRTSDKMGIVYTPNEVVDYILHSTDRILFENFGKHLADEGVHFLDPFTGTGTFVVNLLNDEQLMPAEKLAYKYANEIHCNEILLLAYYIACINIEHSYHSRMGGLYEAFPGAVLTDTFQMHEAGDTLDLGMFVENSERVLKQIETPIHVLCGNPPWSAGQGNANDNNQNEKYPTLDARIEATYAAKSDATNKNSLYDQYIRAFRWASDRIGDHGIVSFVTNGGWLRSDSGAGMRRCLVEEFSDIYVYDLRGNARTSGEQRRKEKDNVFGQGTRTPVVITMLVKNPSAGHRGVIHYHDIGDYLTREDKLKLVEEAMLTNGPVWTNITPDRHGDWLDQRDDSWYRFAPVGLEKLRKPQGIFTIWSCGVKTQRDTWAWNYSADAVAGNIASTISFYNGEMNRWAAAGAPGKHEDFVNTDAEKISWSRALLNDFKKGNRLVFDEEKIRIGSYRPFCKQNVYFDKNLNEMLYQTRKLFPKQGSQNKLICFTMGSKPSSLMTDTLPDLHFVGDSQCFPLYYYDEEVGEGLFGGASGVTRRDSITDQALKVFRAVYPDVYRDRSIEKAKGHGLTDRQAREERAEIAKIDIFYYVYGVLHSPEYRERFAANLAKELPRIPFTGDFKAFASAGRKLAELHLEYEKGPKYPLEIKYSGDATEANPGRVIKLKWGKKTVEGKKVDDKTVIVYNGNVTITGIPEATQRYTVNGRTGLEWILDRYQVKTDKASGIVNDPNEYSEGPRYILDLIQRVTYVSVETMAVVDSLPPLSEIEPPEGVMPIEWTMGI